MTFILNQSAYLFGVHDPFVRANSLEIFTRFCFIWFLFTFLYVYYYDSLVIDDFIFSKWRKWGNDIFRSCIADDLILSSDLIWGQAFHTVILIIDADQDITTSHIQKRDKDLRHLLLIVDKQLELMKTILSKFKYFFDSIDAEQLFHFAKL